MKKIILSFIGLALLTGCASSIKKPNEYLTYSADFKKPLNAMGNCIVENSGPVGLLNSSNSLVRRRVSLNEYTILPARIGNGFPFTLTKVNNSTTNIKLNVGSDKITDRIHKQVDEYKEIFQACATPFNIEQGIHPTNIYAKKTTPADKKRVSAILAGGSKGAYQQLMAELRSRDRAKERLMIEGALAGKLKPLQTYYTERVYSGKLSPHYMRATAFPAGGLFYNIIVPFRNEVEIDANTFTLFCATLGKSKGLFAGDDPTDERIINLYEGGILIDSALVDKGHRFYARCKKGTLLEGGGYFE